MLALTWPQFASVMQPRRACVHRRSQQRRKIVRKLIHGISRYDLEFVQFQNDLFWFVIFIAVKLSISKPEISSML
jgi:hypothetical protein